MRIFITGTARDTAARAARALRTIGADVYVPSHLRTAFQVEAVALRADLHDLTSDATGALFVTTPVVDETASMVRLEIEVARRSGVMVYTLPQALDLIERVAAERQVQAQEAAPSDGGGSR